MSFKVFIIIQACCFSVAFISAVFVLITHADDTIIARHIRTIDGDTFVADVAYPCGRALTEIKVCLINIDTPELKSKNPVARELAQLAKAFAEAKLSGAKKITLEDVHRGKDFRIVATVLVDGKDLGAELVQEGLAEEKE